jgi:hypothetical protein
MKTKQCQTLLDELGGLSTIQQTSYAVHRFQFTLPCLVEGTVISLD